MSQFTLFITINLNSYRVQKLCYPEGFSFFWLGQGGNRSTYCLELTGDFVMEREGRQQCILWKSSVYFVYTLCILSWWVVYSEVPQTKYLGPLSSNIQYLTSPDQKLSKNIYFMGSERSISLFVLDQGCSIPQLQQPNLGQNCLTKIGARPDKTSHKLLLRPKILA